MPSESESLTINLHKYNLNSKSQALTLKLGTRDCHDMGTPCVRSHRVAMPVQAPCSMHACPELAALAQVSTGCLIRLLTPAMAQGHRRHQDEATAKGMGSNDEVWALLAHFMCAK